MSRAAFFPLLLLALVGCGSSTVAPDATVHPDVPRADTAVDGADSAPPRDAPPDDVDPTCRLGATEACLNHPPGPCADLADGLAHAVDLRGLAHDHTLSCTGRSGATGPDAVLPLTLTATSDVVISAGTDANDGVAVALFRADRCGEAAGELQCANGGFSIGGTATFQASNLAPGRYAVVVTSGAGAAVRVAADVRAARARVDGDLCPGVRVTPDGAPVTVDTRRYVPFADYGTTCGYLSQGGVNWVDAVLTYTLTAQRDVTIEVGSATEADVQVDVTPVCGARALALVGCASGQPATRTLRNQMPGTYYVTVDYRASGRPDAVLTARVTTAPPTPPGPAATCPGVPLAEATARDVDIETLTAGTPLRCTLRQRAAAVFSITTPDEPADVVVNVAAPGMRSEAAMALRPMCGADPVGECVGSRDRFARYVWARYQGLRPATTYVLDAATSATEGNLSARWYRVPVATERAVTGAPDCAGATEVTEAGGVFTGSTAGATASLAGSPCVSASPQGCSASRGAWYRLALTARRRVVARLSGDDYDTLLALHRGDTCPGTSTTCNDDWIGTNSLVEAVLDPGTHWVFAGGCGEGAAGRYQLDVMVLPP